MKKFLLAILSLSLTIFSFGKTNGEKKKTLSEEQIHDVSYAYGMIIADALKAENADWLRVDDFANAIKSVLSGEETQMTAEEAENIKLLVGENSKEFHKKSTINGVTAEKASYCIGIEVATSFIKDGFSFLDADVFAGAMKSVFKGEKMLMTLKEAQNGLMLFLATRNIDDEYGDDE